MQNNYKKKLFDTVAVLLTGISIVSLFMPATAQFSQVKPYISPKKEIKVPEDYKQYLIKAMELHMKQFELNDLKATIMPTVSLHRKNAQFAQEKFTAMNACNVKNLSGIYKNPEEAWKKMTEAYNQKERELTVYVNAAMPQPQVDGWENAHPYWRIGREVLIDVYANPENYGEMKSPESGFSRWKDQDYIYAEQVNQLLQNVVGILGVPNVPGVSRLNDYAKNAAAYTSFLSQMKKTNPTAYAKLAPEMLSFPQPPKPLPPANEIIVLTTEASQGQLFPSMPEPWAYYTKNKQVQRLPNGEMNEYYKPNSLQLRPEVGDKMLENRFAVYQEQKYEVATTKEAARVANGIVANRQKEIDEALKNLGVDATVDVDNLDNTITKIGVVKKEQIEKARSLMDDLSTYESSQLSDRMRKFTSLSMEDKLKALDEIDRNSPEYSQAQDIFNADGRRQDLEYLNAMERDINGTAMLTATNAKDVEQMMKASVAQKELEAVLYEREIQGLEKARTKKIDKDCLNGGI